MMLDACSVKKQFSSKAESETLALGAKLGGLLQGGEVLELVSDLGGGKTVFIRGLAKGLGYEREITSPTFTISRVYNLPGGKQLHHFDFYRLTPGDIVDAELAEVMGDKDVITAIEWAKHSGDALPNSRIVIEIHSTAGDERQIIIQGAEEIVGKLS